MNEFFRWYPLAFGVLYLGSTLLRAWLVGRKLRLNPIMLRFDTLNARTLLVQFLMVVYSLIAVHIVLFVARAPAYEFFGPIAALDRPWARGLGLALTFPPWAFIWLSQAHLGTSWRLGIDEAHENVLKTAGMYRYVRHPIYTAMVLIAVGLFLLMPSVLSALIVGFTVVGLNFEAALEERYLARIHGDAYREYLAATGRWLPRWRGSSPRSRPSEIP